MFPSYGSNVDPLTIYKIWLYCDRVKKNSLQLRSSNSYGFKLQIFLHFLIMIQKTEIDTLADNPILGLEAEIRAYGDVFRLQG